MLEWLNELLEEDGAESEQLVTLNGAGASGLLCLALQQAPVTQDSAAAAAVPGADKSTRTAQSHWYSST